MWYLLKTEICYFKWLYIICLAFVILINMGITLDGRWIEAQGDFPGLRIIWLGVGIVVLFFTILFNRKSGRLRYHRLVPISNSNLALIRWLAFVVFWLVLLIVLITFYLINFDGNLNENWFVNLLSLSGIMFTINSIPILYSDFYSSYFKTKEKMIIGIIWVIFWVFYMSLNVIFITYLDFLAPELLASGRQTITNLYFTTEVTFGNVIIGILMFLATIYTFRNRKLYLE